MVAAFANILLRVAFAPVCAVCATPTVHPLEGPICRPCRGGIVRLTAPLCVTCSEPLDASCTVGPLCARCEAARPSFTLARSVGRYEGSLREMVHAFKYRRRRVLAEPLARSLVEAGADVLDGSDAVVPVPLHPLRALERGFNQADDLARLLGRPLWRVLRRVRHGRPQAGLPARHRQDNVRGAFAVKPGWRWPRAGLPGRPQLRNSVVVLIDDVMTTGATLDACSRVLIEAGVRRVGVLTVARSVPAPPARRPPTPHPSIARHR